MIEGFHTEVLMASGYALFLVLVALMLEWLAKHSHRRSEQMRVTGFKYHSEFDHWECPTGQLLHRHSVEHQQNIVRYRAIGHICNCCHKKPDCTDSDEGREIEHRVDSWVQSEIRHYHRGISLAILLLAALILLAQVWWFKGTQDRLLTGGMLVVIGALGARLLAGFRSSPTSAQGLNNQPYSM
ncbi:MAG: hypothetical protein WB819_17050 [Terriglobia bacterium]